MPKKKNTGYERNESFFIEKVLVDFRGKWDASHGGDELPLKYLEILSHAVFRADEIIRPATVPENIQLYFTRVPENGKHPEIFACCRKNSMEWGERFPGMTHMLDESISKVYRPTNDRGKLKYALWTNIISRDYQAIIREIVRDSYPYTPKLLNNPVESAISTQPDSPGITEPIDLDLCARNIARWLQKNEEKDNWKLFDRELLSKLVLGSLKDECPILSYDEKAKILIYMNPDRYKNISGKHLRDALNSLKADEEAVQKLRAQTGIKLQLIGR